MNGGSVLLVALALLVLPGGTAVRRLRTLRPPGRPNLVCVRLPRPGVAVVAGVAAGAGWPVGGPAGALASLAIGATCWLRWSARRAEQRRQLASAGVAEAVGLLVAELRAGAHPAAAAEGAAVDAGSLAARAMSAVAAAARLGGDVSEALRRTSRAEPSLADPLRHLAAAWTLAANHGVPLADVLDAVRRDLDQRIRFARQVRARMAGPRSSATVLAALPLLGVLLGEAVGARPVHVFVSTTIGQILLASGTLLVCAGVLWSARLTDRAVL